MSVPENRFDSKVREQIASPVIGSTTIPLLPFENFA